MQSRQSSDFVLLSEDDKRPLCSDNDKGGFVLVHESPISKRRELRASKELNESDREALEKVIAAVDLAEDEDDDVADEDFVPGSSSEEESSEEEEHPLAASTAASCSAAEDMKKHSSEK